MRKLPPVETRFPVNRKDHTQKHPNGYLLPILKKLLNKKMTVKDEEVRKIFELKDGKTKAELKKVIMLRYILNAVEGENQAIEGIFDRIDGKLKNADGKGVNVSTIVFNFPRINDVLSKTERETLQVAKDG